MRSTHALVVGAGQAGLAISHEFARLGIAHVVLERGRIAERWRSERWDSLRLLTPNWMNVLPGHAFAGPDPDGFMTMPEVTHFLESYAHRAEAPVKEGTEVLALHPAPEGYRIETNRGAWRARVVVIATGHCGAPAVPPFAAALAPSIHQLTASSYRNPSSLPAGGVLVVGAAASAVQIAEELRLAGREVVLSAGRHTRAPRSYRGRDIWWWMHHVGMLEDRAEDQANIARARAQPSLQLTGALPRHDIDLGTLRDAGVRILGRTLGAHGRVLRFADDLAANIAGAQKPLESMLARIDRTADAMGIPSEHWPAPLDGFGASPERLDLAAEGIRSVVWATGYRRDYGWLHLPGLLDADGEPRHRGGITPAPGLYLLGLRFLRRRSSNFLGGVGADAVAIAAEAARHLRHAERREAA
jgi:putative flavoprotein involved in K+ transport